MPRTAARDLSDAHTELSGLKGRKAIITGGTTGIGRAIAVLLAAEGVDVFVCGRTKAHLADALARIREVGKGDGVTVDLSSKEEVERFFAAADDYLGRLDIAVINAAVPAEALNDTGKAEALSMKSRSTLLHTLRQRRPQSSA